VNLCQEDTHCDRNGDAHVKAALFGAPSVSLIVRDGSLVLGRWQKVALVEFDGPREREVLVQIMGRS
jgi:secondary thiamine-phosphate synthase enzyme